MLAKVFLQKILAFYDGDVFYMRRYDLSSNFIIWSPTTPVVGMLMQSQETLDSRSYGFAETTTKYPPSRLLSEETYATPNTVVLGLSRSAFEVGSLSHQLIAACGFPP